MQPISRRPLAIHIERKDNLAIVRLKGAVTIDQADRLTQELRRVADEPLAKVVLDLSGLEFICSMGLGAMIVAHVVSRRHNGQIILSGPQPAIREMLETTRLNMVFPICGDVASAVGE